MAAAVNSETQGVYRGCGSALGVPSSSPSGDDIEHAGELVTVGLRHGPAHELPSTTSAGSNPVHEDCNHIANTKLRT